MNIEDLKAGMKISNDPSSDEDRKVTMIGKKHYMFEFADGVEATAYLDGLGEWQPVKEKKLLHQYYFKDNKLGEIVVRFSESESILNHEPDFMKNRVYVGKKTIEFDD